MSRFAQRWLLPFFDPRSLLRVLALPRFISEFVNFKPHWQRNQTT
jgi:hypothetical protein